MEVLNQRGGASQSACHVSLVLAFHMCLSRGLHTSGVRNQSEGCFPACLSSHPLADPFSPQHLIECFTSGVLSQSGMCFPAWTACRRVGFYIMFVFCAEMSRYRKIGRALPHSSSFHLCPDFVEPNDKRFAGSPLLISGILPCVHQRVHFVLHVGRDTILLLKPVA